MEYMSDVAFGDVLGVVATTVLFDRLLRFDEIRSSSLQGFSKLRLDY
jgi:hypothetical protein